MKTLKFKTDQEWMAARIGKITGSRLGNLISKRGGTKKAFYELIAERVALPGDGENPMDRGHRLEKEAIERFSKETGKKVNDSLIMWISKEDESIAISPDGIIGKTEALEVKCLNSPSHIEALLTKELPGEYYFQSLQYFIVNPKLKKLYFIFYDPRIPHKDFFFFTINRKDREADIATYLAEELRIIQEVERITLELTGF